MSQYIQRGDYLKTLQIEAVRTWALFQFKVGYHDVACSQSLSYYHYSLYRDQCYRRNNNYV